MENKGKNSMDAYVYDEDSSSYAAHDNDKDKKSVFGKYRDDSNEGPMSFDELKELDPTQNGQSAYGNHGHSEEYERIEITEDQTKQCPKCGHRINFSSLVCPYCGKEFK